MAKQTTPPKKGFGGSWQNDATVDGGRNDFTPGDYLVLMTENQWISDGEHNRLKVHGVVVHTIQDLGDAKGSGDEVDYAIFKRAKTSFFERDTKKLCRAAENLGRDEANALDEATIYEKLVETQVTAGRVLEFQVRADPARPRKDGTNPHEGKVFLKIEPRRCVGVEEITAMLKAASPEERKRAMKVLNEHAPDGIVEPDQAEQEDA
jgi:hypothetical protein